MLGLYRDNGKENGHYYMRGGYERWLAGNEGKWWIGILYRDNIPLFPIPSTSKYRILICPYLPMYS